MDIKQNSEFIFYTGKDGKIKVQIILGNETVWATQKSMSEIFGVDRSVITKHLQNIFLEGELIENSVSAKIAHTASDGKTYQTTFYNLDAIIALGYRVNSYQATQFRIWASGILKEYMIKGFALDDERLKQGKKLFDKDYFQELLGRIREIRASERRFYQKITDIYSQCSIDYDKNSPITTTFFSTVQNKLEFAITHMTAAEIIKKRADCKLPNMGLQTWDNSPKGKVLKKDVTVAKNYLNEAEISELNRIVNMYLDYAENQASKQRTMKMNNWIEKLDAFLTFNEYEILNDAGRVRKSVADIFAEKEYEKFRVIQDQEYKSDFDEVVAKVRITGILPKEIPITTYLQTEEENTMSFADAIRTIGKAGKPQEKS